MRRPESARAKRLAPELWRFKPRNVTNCFWRLAQAISCAIVRHCCSKRRQGVCPSNCETHKRPFVNRRSRLESVAARVDSNVFQEKRMKMLSQLGMFAAALVCLFLSPSHAVAQDKDEKGGDKKPEQSGEAGEKPKEEISVTDHTIKIGGEKFSYKCNPPKILLKGE